MKGPVAQMPEPLVSFLQSKRLVLVVTTDPTGQVRASALSWVYAVSERILRFAVDQKARLLDAVRQGHSLLFLVVGPDSTYSIQGTGRESPIPVEDSPIRLAVVEVEVSEVDDIMFYGGVVTAAPAIAVTYGQDLADKLDRSVFSALSSKEIGQ